MNKKLKLTLFFFFIAGLFALFVGGKVPYFLFYILLLYLTLPLIHVLSGLIFIRGLVNLPVGEFYTGDIINIKYEVKNSAIFTYPNLIFIPKLSKELGDRFFPSQSFYLQKKDRWSQTISTDLDRRGQYKVGAFSLEISDVFHLYSFSKEMHSHIEIVIYPRLIPLKHFSLPARLRMGELKVSLQSTPDKSLIKNLRDYVDGDSGRLIHWKATSKSSNPIVKEFENTSDLSLEIFLDSKKVEFKKDIDRRLEDKMVEIALSITNYCLLKEIRVSIRYEKDNKFHYIEGTDYRDLKSFLKSLAIFSAQGQMDFSNLISSESEFLQNGANIILITPSVDSRLGGLLLELTYKGIEAAIVLLQKEGYKLSHKETSLIQRLRDANIPVFLVYPRSNMDKVFGGLR